MNYLYTILLIFIGTLSFSQSKKSENEKFLANCYIATSVVTNHPKLVEDRCKLVIHPKKHVYGYLCDDISVFDVIGKWKKIDGNKIQLIFSETKEIMELTIKEWSDQKIILSGLIEGYKYEVTLQKK